MVGRSSRNFGQCCGTVYVLSDGSDVLDKTKGGYEHLNRMKFIGDDNGHRIGGYLFKKLNRVACVENRKLICNVFGMVNPKWRISVNELREKSQLAYSFLFEDTYRLSS